MDKKIQIFVSYIHLDKAYLNKDSLLGYLQGLEKDNIEFWTDREIKPVVRGGSWYSLQDHARAAVLNRSHPDRRNSTLGFRLVCSSPHHS